MQCAPVDVTKSNWVNKSLSKQSTYGTIDYLQWKLNLWGHSKLSMAVTPQDQFKLTFEETQFRDIFLKPISFLTQLQVCAFPAV